MTTVVGLADELLEVQFDAEPVVATVLGFHERDHLLGDPSEAGDAARRVRLADIRQRAAALAPAELSGQDRATRSVVLSLAGSAIDRIDDRLVEFNITDLYSAPVADVLFSLPILSLADQEQADAYLERLGGLPGWLSAIGKRQRAGVAAGRLPVAHLVQAAIGHLDRFLADRDTDPLRRPDYPGGGEAFRVNRDRLIDETARPAFGEYRRMLAEELLPQGRPAERGGLCWLPGGEGMYQRLIRAHTTTERSAQELHRTGLEVVANLAEEYRGVGSRVFGTSDLREIFHRLRTDPALRWRNGDELLDSARATIQRADAAAPRWFGRLPSQQCVVEAVPATDAPGAPGAYYLSPAMDGSRPGTYYANTHRVTERDRYSSEAVTFHEAIPGHHFQQTIAQELTGLPVLRRLGQFNVYSEGWGLYAERLADEMGLYSDDLSRFGMLSADSMRAARLVVDTGIHAFGWSRQQTIDYLTENTVLSAVEIHAETDRYIADPGQALAYMVGRLEIQRIRANAEKSLGDRFDVRGFHDTVLGCGAVPLTALDEIVHEWVANA